MQTLKDNREMNKERWQRHVELADKYTGTISAYCQAEGLSLHAMCYWRQKLKRERRAMPAMVGNHSVRALSPFIPIQVTPMDSKSCNKLPDAAWVAELILHLSAGGSR